MSSRGMSEASTPISKTCGARSRRILDGRSSSSRCSVGDTGSQWTPMTKRSGSLAVRLALSFVAVAVLAVAIGAVLAIALSGHDINVMVQQRRSDLTRSLLVDAASTYNSGRPGWTDADLRPALALASQSGTDVAVLNLAGKTVASTIADPSQAADARRTPIVVDGAHIGT